MFVGCLGVNFYFKRLWFLGKDFLIFYINRDWIWILKIEVSFFKRIKVGYSCYLWFKWDVVSVNNFVNRERRNI